MLRKAKKNNFVGKIPMSSTCPYFCSPRLFFTYFHFCSLKMYQNRMISWNALLILPAHTHSMEETERAREILSRHQPHVVTIMECQGQAKEIRTNRATRIPIRTNRATRIPIRTLVKLGQGQDQTKVAKNVKQDPRRADNRKRADNSRKEVGKRQSWKWTRILTWRRISHLATWAWMKKSAPTRVTCSIRWTTRGGRR